MLAYLKLSSDFHEIRFSPGTWEVGQPTCSTAILRNAAVKTSPSNLTKIWAFNSDSYPCKYLLLSPVLMSSPMAIYQYQTPNTRQELQLYPNFWRRGPGQFTDTKYIKFLRCMLPINGAWNWFIQAPLSQNWGVRIEVVGVGDEEIDGICTSYMCRWVTKPGPSFLSSINGGFAMTYIAWQSFTHQAMAF